MAKTPVVRRLLAQPLELWRYFFATATCRQSHEHGRATREAKCRRLKLHYELRQNAF